VKRASIAWLVLALGVATVVIGGEPRADAGVNTPLACSPARVQYAPYPGRDPVLARLPWVRGKPAQVGLVGLLWYWPSEWQAGRVRTARIFVGGQAPAGYSTKVLWTFVAPSSVGAGGRTLTVQGARLDGTGRFTQEFAAISFSGQNGEPSYASIIDVPIPGCWRLNLRAGLLRASLTLLAVGPTT
jgi:hypothetical protein